MTMTPIRLPWGRLKDDATRMISIDDALRGHACACVCPKCAGDLIAAKGDIYRHHFRHAADVPCYGARETALHLFAKQIICERRACAYPRDYVGFRDTPFRIDLGSIIDARAEVPLAGGDMRADVVLTFSSGEEVAVEIYVAHRVDAHKLRLFATRAIAAIEIDLRDYRHADKDDDDWCAAILDRALRYWLVPPASVRMAERAMRLEWLRERRRILRQMLHEQQAAEAERLARERELQTLAQEQAETLGAQAALHRARREEEAAQSAALRQQQRIKTAIARARIADLSRAIAEQNAREQATPDLQRLIAVHDGYDRITPQAWHEYEGQVATYRRRINAPVVAQVEFVETLRAPVAAPVFGCIECDHRARFGYRIEGRMRHVCPFHRIARHWADERYY
jgi:hypothetical protein